MAVRSLIAFSSAGVIFDLDHPHAGVANRVVVVDPVRALNEDLVFHAGRVGQAANAASVVASDASRGGKRKRRSAAGGHHSSLAVEQLGDPLTDGVAKIFQLDKFLGRDLHGRDGFRPHQGAGQRREGAGRVDERTHAELLDHVAALGGLIGAGWARFEQQSHSPASRQEYTGPSAARSRAVSSRASIIDLQSVRIDPWEPGARHGLFAVRCTSTPFWRRCRAKSTRAFAPGTDAVQHSSRGVRAAQAQVAVPLPARVASRAIAFRQRIPIRPRQAVELIGDPAVAQRHLTSQFLGAGEPGAKHIEEAEFAMFEPEHRDVGEGADREMTQLLLLDLAGRIPG